MWVLTPGDLFAQRYRILRELGSGGMAHVFAAEDEELGGTIALKIIKPDFVGEQDFVARFKREVRIARQIRHPNIIQVLEFGSDVVREKRLYYLTMELLEGRDLSAWIRESKELALADTLRIGLQLCDALSEAHRVGVVHRDIKPQNVFIQSDGRVKLMDFGISRISSLPSVTTGGQLIGTPKYMSPEQVHRQTEPDRRSDIYSLGVLLYELATGSAPFDGQSTVEVALKHVQQIPPRPSELRSSVPPELEKVLLKCLEKEPGRRYDSVNDLRAELERVPSVYDASATANEVTEVLEMPTTDRTRSTPRTAVEGGQSRPGPAVASSTGPWTTIRRRSRALPGRLFLAGLAAVVAIAVALFVLRGVEESSPPSEARVPSEEQPEVPPAETLEPEPPQPTSPPSSAPTEPSSEETSSPPAMTPAEPAAPAASSRGTLVLESEPSPASVHVDGELVGETPWRGNLAPGTRRITLEASGFAASQESVELAAGQTLTRRVRLSPLTRTETVRFSANPGTRVYLDDELLGTIPPVIEAELTTGAHRVRYQMPDYAEEEVRIEVEPRDGQEFSHQFPVPGALRVNTQPYARVFLDGDDLGYTPARVERVSEGEHRLVVEREGFQRIEQTIIIEPFKINRFQFELVPEP